jgi:hypothetical protein
MSPVAGSNAMRHGLRSPYAHTSVPNGFPAGIVYGCVPAGVGLMRRILPSNVEVFWPF